MQGNTPKCSGSSSNDQKAQVIAYKFMSQALTNEYAVISGPKVYTHRRNKPYISLHLLNEPQHCCRSAHMACTERNVPESNILHCRNTVPDSLGK